MSYFNKLFYHFTLLSLTLHGLTLHLLSAQAETEQKFTIVIIPQVADKNHYWQIVYTGAFKSAQEFKERNINVEILWKDISPTAGWEDQAKLLQTCLLDSTNETANAVDGIVLAPMDPDALAKTVEELETANVPVVIIDSALNSSKYTSLISTDNKTGGQKAAIQMGDLLDRNGRLLVFHCSPATSSTLEREESFLKYVKLHYSGMETFSPDEYSGVSQETAYQASLTLLKRYEGKLDGIFTPNRVSTLGMNRALKELGKADGSIKHIGFDADRELIEAMKNGELQALVLSDPMLMGYQGVKHLTNRLRGGMPPSIVYTNVRLVTPDSLETPAIQKFISPLLGNDLN